MRPGACPAHPGLPGLGHRRQRRHGPDRRARGNGYARQRVTFSGTGPQQKTDAVRFTFATGVGALTHVGLFDAATGGNPLTWSALSQAAQVTAAGTVTINPAGLVVTPG